MKKLITYALFILSCTVVCAQENTPTATQSKVEKTQLSPFNAIDINASMKIRLVRASAASSERMEYDLKGVEDSKFEYWVKDSTLYIRERVSLRRSTNSEATIYFNTISSLIALRANINIETPLESKILDIKLHSEASISTEVRCKDLKFITSGRSSARIWGQSKYLSVIASSSSKSALRELKCNAASIDASHGATIEVGAEDKLEIKSVVGAVVRYHGTPDILRTESSMIGGEIIKMKDE